MEVCHNIVSAGWWNDHSFTLGEEVTIDGEFITEAPVGIWLLCGHNLVYQANHPGESVHCQENGGPCNFGEMSWGEGKHQYSIDSEV